MEKCFPEDTAVCLGDQLISIIQSLKDCLPSHIWYGADVDAVGENATNPDLQGFQLKPIGTDLQFTQYCSRINQFIWGVFVCIDSNSSFQDIQSVELKTEDEQFRSIALNGIFVEIRAFDTSYFEIYSEDEKILERISAQFNSAELTCKD
jgi:hypothetical protein